MRTLDDLAREDGYLYNIDRMSGDFNGLRTKLLRFLSVAETASQELPDSFEKSAIVERVEESIKLLDSFSFHNE